jgi:hypothetical protein
MRLSPWITGFDTKAAILWSAAVARSRYAQTFNQWDSAVLDADS